MVANVEQSTGQMGVKTEPWKCKYRCPPYPSRDSLINFQLAVNVVWDAKHSPLVYLRDEPEFRDDAMAKKMELEYRLNKYVCENGLHNVPPEHKVRDSECAWYLVGIDLITELLRCGEIHLRTFVAACRAKRYDQQGLRFAVLELCGRPYAEYVSPSA